MQIDIEDLFYLYESEEEKIVALRGLFLQVKTGECLVIKGPNGSGKSTLVRLLSGFLQPSAGRILFDGRAISTLDPLQLRRELISSIDQKGNLLPDLSIRENVALGFTLTGHSHSSADTQTEGLLSSHNLEHLLDSYPSQLSAGERQLCSLLVAIASNPKILVADEPSGELDDIAAEKIFTLIQSLAGKTTIILVTHDERAEKYADRIVRIRNGRISSEWLPNGAEEPVIDPYGWQQVDPQNSVDALPRFNLSPEASSEYSCLLHVNALALSIGSRSIFSGINFDAMEGDFIALTGASGSGKSSLLRILCGIQNPTHGNVYVDNQLLSELSRDARARLRGNVVSYLPQGNGSISLVTLEEYFADTKLPDLAHFLSRKNRSLSRFSGGERAYIEIYERLSQGRKIFIFDEPTSQLDEKRSYEIAGLLVNHASRGGVVIASTRDPLLLSCANKVVSL